MPFEKQLFDVSNLTPKQIWNLRYREKKKAEKQRMIENGEIPPRKKRCDTGKTGIKRPRSPDKEYIKPNGRPRKYKNKKESLEAKKEKYQAGFYRYYKSRKLNNGNKEEH